MAVVDKKKGYPEFKGDLLPHINNDKKVMNGIYSSSVYLK